MKKTIFLLVVLLAFMTLSCKKATESTTGTVVGTVTDSTTGEVLAGVKVEIEDLEISTTTSSTGEYSFIDIETGYYYMQFTLTGYDTLSEYNTISSSYIDTLDVAMVYQDTVVVTKAVNIDLAGDDFYIWRKSEYSIISYPSWVTFNDVTESIFDSYIYNFTCQAYTGTDYGRYDSIIISEVSTGDEYSIPISQGNVMYHEASGSDETISTDLENMFGWDYGSTVTTLHLYGTLNYADLIQIGSVMLVEELGLYNTTIIGDVKTNHTYSGITQQPDGSVVSNGGVITQDGNAIPYTFMNTFDYDEESKYTANTTLKSIILPKETTTIGERAFAYCTALESVSGEGVTYVGRYSFRYCSALKTIDLAASIQVDEYAFSDCPSISSMSFPVATTINNNSFMNSTTFSSVSFPSLITVGSYAFYGCTNLSSISFPTATHVGEASFYGCTSLGNSELESAISIGDYAFYDCATFTKVTLPVVETIGRGAFRSCDNLSTVDYPTVTTLDAEAFMNCTSLTTLEFPLVTSAGSYAFSGCTALTTISLPEVTSIGTYAFSGSNSLVDLSIATNSQLTSSEMVFSNYSNSSEATLTVGSANSSSVDGNVFTDSADNSTTFSEIVVQ